MEFKQLKLNPKILDAIAREGYEKPSPIQEMAIPPALEGNDLLGCAQTGTGKTAAFAMPILDRLATMTASLPAPNHGKRTIRALVLTPTRELADQIYQSFRSYGRYLKLKSAVIMGGVSQYLHRDVLNNGADILVATPGRLIDYVTQGLLDISKIEIFVLDEADRMLDMGFIQDVKKILERIPANRQTLFFTATMPAEVRKLANTILKNPISISVSPPSSTTELTSQYLYLTDKMKKTDLLIWLLKNDPTMVSTLVFTRTKYGADRLTKCLNRAGIQALAIHGDKSQGARQNALGSFKAGKIRVLAATDIAARGIDIDSLSHVVNYELPNVPETYVHRIGRTGRAGKTGKAISLCDYDERNYLTDIEKLIGKDIEEVTEHPYPMEVFTATPPKPQQQRPKPAYRSSYSAGPSNRRR